MLRTLPYGELWGRTSARHAGHGVDVLNRVWAEGHEPQPQPASTAARQRSINREIHAPLVIILILLMASRVLAQGLPSGSIAGSVTTAVDGQPLTGVAVTVRSPALQGARQTMSAVNGDFLLANLPPGEYTVELELQGFQAVTQPGLRVGTSQRQELAVAMSPAAFAGEVTVTASTNLVSNAPASATILASTVINQLPIPRTMESAALLAPGINARPANSVVSAATDAFSIAGGETYENVITIDGVSPQENYFRLPEPLYIEDAVVEVATLTSGISAEHGWFAGGVVNVLTKSGGNSLSGSLRTTLINDAWSAQTPAGEERFDDVTPVYEVTLGGPLWRDRIWLFGAARYVDQTTVSATAPPTSIDFPTERTETRYHLKLTVSPLASQTLTLSAVGFDRDLSDTYFTPFPILDVASTYDDQVEEQSLLANYSGTLSTNLFVEAHYGTRRLTHVFGGDDMSLAGGTPVIAAPFAFSFYNAPVLCAVCPDPEDIRNSDQGVLKATYFAPTSSLGSHAVVTGAEFYEGSYEYNNRQSGSGYWVWGTDVILDEDELYPVFGPGTTLDFYPIFVPAALNHIRTYAAYVNDTWLLSDRLTLNLGVRWDKNHARDPVGVSLSDQGGLSPRLAAAWDPTGKGAVRLTASYGRYVSTLAENQIAWTSAFGTNGTFKYDYDGPPINTNPAQPLVSRADALHQLFDWFGITEPGQFPTAGINPFYAVYPGVSLKIRGDLQAQRADEATLGVNGSLGGWGSFRVDAVYRTYGDFYVARLDTTTGTATDPYGNVYDLGFLTNTNEQLERRHLALRSSAQFQLGTTLTAGGSWTWGRTRGNQVSESMNAGPNPPLVLTYPEYWELAWHAPVGDLIQDVRHRVRLWATWDMTFLPSWLGSWSLSPLFALDTGLPYGVSGDILIEDYVTNPGYVTPPQYVTYWFTNRDAYRTPTVTRLDLALNWSLRLGEVELFVQPQVVNILNGHEIAWNEPSLLDQGVLTAVWDTELQPFDPFTEQPVEGVHYAKSPTFGKALGPAAYQQPRTFTISLGVRF